MAAATQRELQAHLVRSVLAAQQNCAPELLDLIGGSTIQQIDESVARVRATTAQILNRARQAQIRPSDQDDPGPGFQAFVREGLGDQGAPDPASMSMSEWAEYRKRFIRPADQGLFTGMR